MIEAPSVERHCDPALGNIGQDDNVMLSWSSMIDR